MSQDLKKAQEEFFNDLPQIDRIGFAAFKHSPLFLAMKEALEFCAHADDRRCTNKSNEALKAMEEK